MTNSTSDEREQRLSDIRRARELGILPWSHLSSPTQQFEVARDTIDFLLSLLDSEAVDTPLTGVIADIEMREGVLDGWHVETVLITPDERDDLVRDWKALQSQIDQFKQQFQLLDDPDGLYSETKSLIESNAATTMRSLCVEKVRGMMRSRDGVTDPKTEDAILRRNAILGEVLIELQSLTLEQVEQK